MWVSVNVKQAHHSPAAMASRVMGARPATHLKAVSPAQRYPARLDSSASSQLANVSRCAETVSLTVTKSAMLVISIAMRSRMPAERIA
jgi:hypothetical protein